MKKALFRNNIAGQDIFAGKNLDENQRQHQNRILEQAKGELRAHYKDALEVPLCINRQKDC